MRSRSRPAAASVRPAPNVGLTLFLAPNAWSSDWARLVLAEKEVDGAALRFITPGVFDEDFVSLNPTQSLPTLADREGVIQGGAVIAEYLDERYPHPPLMPLVPAGRAKIRMLIRQLERDVFPLIEQLSGSTSEVASARLELQRNLLGNARIFPSRGYFFGAEYTLADTLWAILLRRMLAAGVTIPGDGGSMKSYAERLFTRPAFMRCFDRSAPVKSNSRKT